MKLYLIEILHQTTTTKSTEKKVKKLYLIEILHQTTTILVTCQIEKMLYLIEILHQTTTVTDANWIAAGCILSKFYIKPQPRQRARW